MQTWDFFGLFREVGVSNGSLNERLAPADSQSRRDCVLQPRVARNELPWEIVQTASQPQRGCGRARHPRTQFRWGWLALAHRVRMAGALWLRRQDEYKPQREIVAWRYRFQGAQLGYHSAKQQTASRLPVCATSHPRSVSVAVPRCAQLLSASEKALAQQDSALVSNPLSCDHMRTIVLIILIGLLAAGLATHLVMRHHYLAQLEMNRIALQQSANRIEELAAENARLAGVANQRKLTAHELSDLLRLRAEVGQLRRAKS